MLAHILGPGGAPSWAEWLAALALFGGALGAAIWWRQPTRRHGLLAVSGAGLVATAALLVTQPSLPLSPGYGIQLADARQATSPVVLQVCGARDTASPAPIPGQGRLLLITVDGRQVAETRTSTVTVQMATGTHEVVAQLITSDHRAFVPPVTTTATLTVTGPGPIAATPGCGATR